MRTLVKRWMAVAVSLLMVLGCCLMAAVQTQVSALDPSNVIGIQNNGLNGVQIEIKSAPYLHYNNVSPNIGYNSNGCTWFVASRIAEDLGFYIDYIWSAESWVSYGNAYGTVELTKNGNVTITPDSVLCYYGNGGTHVAYVERVDGNTVTISEGGQTYAEWYGTRNPADYGYCIIREVSLSNITSSNGIPLQGVVHLTSGGGTPVDPPAPSLTASWINSSSFDGLNGRFYSTISTNNKASFTEAGITVWQDGALVVDHSEAAGANDWYMDMWWTPQELGLNLSEGHTYTYRFYAVANGQRFESEVYSYTTPGAPALGTSWENFSSFDGLNANFYGTISTNNKASFTEAGITVWQDGVLVTAHSETASANDWYMNMWWTPQELGFNLSEGHTYTYQFYAVANGQRFESEVYSYTTPAPEPVQQQNQWTQELSMEGWTYGETANAPAASAQYGEVVFTYSDAEDGSYSAEIPTNAGTYYVKAEVAETSEYTGLTATTSFTIAKATPELPDVGELNAIYGQQLSDIALPDGMSWSENQGEEFDGTVGDCQTDKLFYADYTPEDTKNYVTLLEQPVSVNVLPRDISDLELPEITADTNLEELSLTLDGLELVLNRDYTIETWEDAENGVMVVNFEGTGNYTGICSATYPIAEEPVNPPEEGSDPGAATPDNSSGNNNGSANDTETESDVPQTGDNTAFAITWLAAAMLLSGCGVIIAVKKQKKSR